MSDMLAAALALAALGKPVFPCWNVPDEEDKHKSPMTSHGFYDATTDQAKIKQWWGRSPNALIGMRTGGASGVAVLDLDVKHGKNGYAAVPDWETRSPVTAKTQSGGAHLYFNVEGSPPSTIEKIARGVDTRGENGYVIVPPSPGYTWLNGSDLSAVLPPFPSDLLAALRKDNADDRPHTSAAEFTAPLFQIAAAVEAIPNDDLDNYLDWGEWNRIGMAIWNASDGNEAGFDIFDQFSQRSGKYNSRTTDKRWRSYFRSPPTSVGFGTLHFLATEATGRIAGEPVWERKLQDQIEQRLFHSAMDPEAERRFFELLRKQADKPAVPVLVEPAAEQAAAEVEQAKVEHPKASADSEAKPEPKSEPEAKPEPKAKPETATTTENWSNPVDLWSTFDPPELPVGSLPGVIEKFARIEGDNMGCDPAGLAIAALVACAAAIPDTIKLQVKEHDPHWTEPARVWAALVGDPSAKKSPILNHAARPIGKIDRKMIAQYMEAKKDYDELSADDKKNNPLPKQPRLKIEDTTIEAAQEVLKDSPHGVLCLQDELSGFLGAIDKYSGNKGAGADRAFWMRAYNGGPSSFHRIARGSGLIPNLSVNLLGGIQPDAIRKVAADGVDDGLLQRMLFIVLRPATVDQDKPRDPVVKDYFKLVDRLHECRPPLCMDDEITLRFDKGAQAIRSGLAKKHIELMGSELVNKKLATHVGKYDGVFARLCVLWHCIENVDHGELPKTITENTAQRVATFLHDFLFIHAVAFYVSIVGLSDDHERLRNVAGYILARRLTVVRNRDVQRGDRNMRKLTDFETFKIFEQLEALGWIERKLPTRPPQKIQWTVNPAVHTQFAQRAKREADRRDEARETIARLFAKGGR